MLNPESLTLSETHREFSSASFNNIFLRRAKNLPDRKKRGEGFGRSSCLEENQSSTFYNSIQTLFKPSF
jgi:hypothetical protein